jgi:hypothetical protein
MAGALEVTRSEVYVSGPFDEITDYKLCMLHCDLLDIRCVQLAASFPII